MNHLSNSSSSKILISQVQLTPDSVAAKSQDLQVAMTWGLRVSFFILSLLMLASIIRYLLKINQ